MGRKPSKTSQKKILLILNRTLVVGVIALICFFHLLWLAEIPNGLVPDEISTGHNALYVASTGRDAYGTFFPIYFRSLGDYKNPSTLYMAALLLQFFPLSEYLIRFCSFLYFLGLLASIYFITRTVFPKERDVSFFALLSVGFLPWFFQLSRLGFVAMSFAASTAFSIFFVIKLYKTLDQNNTSKFKSLVLSIASGICIGISLYSYFPGQFTSPALLVTSIFLLYSKKNIKYLLVIIGSTAVCYLPYAYLILFSGASKPSPLVRFHQVSYLNNANIDLVTIFQKFFNAYSSYFSADFLHFSGEIYRRPQTGFMGVSFFIISVLFISCLIFLLFSKVKKHKKIILFLLCNLLLAPIPAGIARGDRSTYSIVMGIYFVLLACFAFSQYKAILSRYRTLISTIIILTLCIEITFFLSNYFGVYAYNPKRSAHAFASSGMVESIESCIHKNPDLIYLNTSGKGMLAFYKAMFRHRTSIEIRNKLPKNKEKKVCHIYHRKNKTYENCRDLSNVFPGDAKLPFYQYRKWHACMN